jgi:3-oxoacyl-[acyl-carrier protein] reductase
MSSPAFVVVGASGGIGSEVCRRLAKPGVRLVLAARDAARLEALAAECHAKGAECAVEPCDATDSTAIDAVFGRAGSVVGAVNLCGSILLKPAHATTNQEFADTLAANVTTAFNVLRGAVKVMAEGGSVVLMSSVAARFGLPNHEAIAAAKGAVGGLVLAAAATYAPRKIRVNAVAPALVRTPLSAKITANELSLKASTAMHPLGRIGEPADIAAVVAWLLAGESGWVTGQVFGVDGGMSAVKGK